MRGNFRAVFYFLLISALLLSVIGCTQEKPYRPEAKEQTQELQPNSNLKLQQVQTQDRVLTSGTIVEVAHSVIPAVVGISTVEFTRENLWSEPVAVQGVGSGVVVHPDGYILTNDHVVGGKTSKISVIFRNSDELEGVVLWTDPTLDLAVVKVDAFNLAAAPLGSSENLAVGETAIAVGTPLGLQFKHTVTAGIISALNRTVRVPTNLGENFMEDLIQTDASINPGNSGGPLVNIKGEIIGINTIKVTSAEGMGFAIPIDVAKPIIQHFIEEGSYVTPYIGIVGFDREMASYYNRNHYVEEGVYVVELDRNGPAYAAGVRINDIIIMVGDQRVSKMLDLRKTIYSYKVGDRLAIRLIRDGRELTVNMTLVEKPV
ncbi:MAG: trypsin-like peptidase domain-containing protein [Caldicoprobacterales bacterium]|jgi:serine protease Do